MKPRNRIFIIMGVLLVIALCWYFFSTKHTSDLQLIGTVDANEVVVSSRIQGRIQSLAVDEGQTVTAGQLVATIEAQDLADARNAAEATVSGDKYKLAGSRDTEEQTQGDTSSQVTAAEAQLRAARATLAQAQAQYEHQDADTTRAVALAQAGVTSQQIRDEQVTSLNAAKAAVETARENVAAAEACCTHRPGQSDSDQSRGKNRSRHARRDAQRPGDVRTGAGPAGLFACRFAGHRHRERTRRARG